MADLNTTHHYNCWTSYHLAEKHQVKVTLQYCTYFSIRAPIDPADRRWWWWVRDLIRRWNRGIVMLDSFINHYISCNWIDHIRSILNLIIPLLVLNIEFNTVIDYKILMSASQKYESHNSKKKKNMQVHCLLRGFS